MTRGLFLVFALLVSVLMPRGKKKSESENDVEPAAAKFPSAVALASEASLQSRVELLER
jgi:hypothetical protein